MFLEVCHGLYLEVAVFRAWSGLRFKVKQQPLPYYCQMVPLSCCTSTIDTGVEIRLWLCFGDLGLGYLQRDGAYQVLSLLSPLPLAMGFLLPWGLRTYMDFLYRFFRPFCFSLRCHVVVPLLFCLACCRFVSYFVFFFCWCLVR